MKKAVLAIFTVAMLFVFAACGGGANGAAGIPASDTDIDLLPGLSVLPEYNGGGSIQFPWDGKTAGYWVSDAELSDMRKFAKKLKNTGWELNDSVEDYDENGILYYTSADGKSTVQLKLMGETYLRVTVGAPEQIEGLR